MVGSAYFVKSTPPRAFNVSFRFFVDLFQIYFRYMCMNNLHAENLIFDKLTAFI